MLNFLRFFKNETITYEVYKVRFLSGIGATIFFYVSFALNLFSFRGGLMLTLFLCFAFSGIFALYNFYRAVMAGLGVYDLKGLLTAFKKLIEKI